MEDNNNLLNTIKPIYWSCSKPVNTMKNTAPIGPSGAVPHRLIGVVIDQVKGYEIWVYELI